MSFNIFGIDKFFIEILKSFKNNFKKLRINPIFIENIDKR